MTRKTESNFSTGHSDSGFEVQKKERVKNSSFKKNLSHEKGNKKILLILRNLSVLEVEFLSLYVIGPSLQMVHSLETKLIVSLFYK